MRLKGVSANTTHCKKHIRDFHPSIAAGAVPVNHDSASTSSVASSNSTDLTVPAAPSPPLADSTVDLKILMCEMNLEGKERDAVCCPCGSLCFPSCHSFPRSTPSDVSRKIEIVRSRMGDRDWEIEIVIYTTLTKELSYFATGCDSHPVLIRQSWFIVCGFPIFVCYFWFPICGFPVLGC